MIIITMNNGFELKYKGNIVLEFDDLVQMLWIYNDNKEGMWSRNSLDSLMLDDIQSIKGI